MRIVDTHHHLWDLCSHYYPWLTDKILPKLYGDYAPIRRDYLIGDFLADIGSLPVVKSVHVNAGFDPRKPVRETEWLQAIADDAATSRGFPHGIVGDVDLTGSDAAAVLENHCRFTVLDNLLLGKLAIGGRKAGFSCDLPDVFDLFPRLRERRDQIAGSLSGGEQQMLAIGRALMGHPRLLLLDEPSLGLAPVIVDQVFAALHRLRDAGISMLVVEQRVQRVLDLADYGYVLDRGRIATQGTSADLGASSDLASHYLGM
jgi:hypothetical protein